MNKTTKAREFARSVHEGHFRRDGETPYFKHLHDVVTNLYVMLYNRRDEYKEYYEDMICAAWLHDSIEDNKTTRIVIESEFGSAVAVLVDHLTHEKGESYEEYIEFTKNLNETRLIKIADILANLADSPSKKQIDKYTKALKILVR